MKRSGSDRQLRSADLLLRSGRRLGAAKPPATPSTTGQHQDSDVETAPQHPVSLAGVKRKFSSTEGDAALDAARAIYTSTPSKRERLSEPDHDLSDSEEPETTLDCIPDDVVLQMFELLGEKELATVAQTSWRYHELAAVDKHWRLLFRRRWGEYHKVMEQAAELAGGWQSLYASKVKAERTSAPWVTPSPHEVSAISEVIKGSVSSISASLNSTPAVSQQSAESFPESSRSHGQSYVEAGLEVAFLLDGSGSVTEEDFSTMINFIKNIGGDLIRSHPESKISVIQFSNDVRIELSLSGMSEPDFLETVGSITRMNGGTNIAAPIKKAAQIFSENPSPNTARVVALLTDGRVDSYQARDAVEKASRLMDELANVSMYAFGVGRGVDKTELTQIISGSSVPNSPEYHRAKSNYLALRVLDEPPWYVRSRWGQHDVLHP